MKTISKFTCDPKLYNSMQVMPIPNLIKVLACANQDGNLCIWAEVETIGPSPTHDVTDVRLWVIGTGYELPDLENVTFLGTVLIGMYVWHVYYK